MLLSNLEYVPLRLARRFLFTEGFLLRFGRLVPHYRVNSNQADPIPVIANYERHLRDRAVDPSGRAILEIGTGATNSTGYEFAARLHPARMYLVEPFVPFAAAEDSRLLQAIAGRHRTGEVALSGIVQRLTGFAAIPDASVDLVLSSSVLEHVSDPPALFRELRRVLRRGGAMLHLVDYRDHFFKYPYHFLQFSRDTWDRWLNPGDLPRWRVYDHLEALAAAGFRPRVLASTQDDAAFGRIRPRLSPDFRAADPLLAVGTAALWAESPAE